jgi:hypothetical protein
MNIYETIKAVIGEIEPISKGRRNTQQGFQYRGIYDVMNELQPVMAKHGLFVVPEVIEATREERNTKSGGTLIYSILKIKYTFYADDGTSIYAVVIGEGMDSGDKASNKAMAVGMKYALLQVLCIPTEDAKDPDAESHVVQPKHQAPAPHEKIPHEKQDPEKVRCRSLQKELGKTDDEMKALVKEHGNYKKIADYLEGLVIEKEAESLFSDDEQRVVDLSAIANVKKTFGGTVVQGVQNERNKRAGAG